MTKTIWAGTIAAAVLSIAPAANAKSTAAAPEDKMICKNQQRTGTRFATKTCRTQSQWEAIAEAARRAASEMIDRPQPNPVAIPGR